MLPDGRYDLHVPDAAGFGVVVLHPHPDYGGDRYNPVVDALYRAAVGEGWAAIRFDFSSSDFDVAQAEAEHALAMLPDDLPIAVFGYSFGSIVAARMVDDRIASWVLVAPPIHGAPVLPVGAVERPKLLLVPEHDQYCPPPVALTSTESWELAYVERVASADHFLAGATEAVATQAVEFVRP